MTLVEKEVPGVSAMEISQLETKYRMTVHSSSVCRSWIHNKKILNQHTTATLTGTCLLRGY